MKTLRRKQRTKSSRQLPEIEVDGFAGGGGASLGIQKALGHSPHVCINHDHNALAMHKANHPESLHLEENVWKVNPRCVVRVTVRKGELQLPPEGWQEWEPLVRVGLLWVSPDCTDFSRAKGSQPISRGRRSLAWVVHRWTKDQEVAPRVIILENVREFEGWGPVVPAWRCASCKWRGTEGQTKLARKRRRCPRCESVRLIDTGELVRDPKKVGITFKRWVGLIRARGYHVEWKVRNAADQGAPTHRRRLFLVARNDGRPIVWPEPTHDNPKKLDRTPLFVRLKPWRPAAECIDWDLPCPSIFDPAARRALGMKAVLVEATMERIARGVKRFVLDNPKPFIVPMNFNNRPVDIDEPLPTQTSQTNRNCLVTPYLQGITHSTQDRQRSVEQPLPTITTAHRGEVAIITPVIIGAGGSAYAGKPREVDRPLGTVKCDNRQAIVASTLVQVGYGERDGQAPRAMDIEQPLGTVVGSGKHALVSAFLAKHFGGSIGESLDGPSGTATSKTHASLVAANLVHLNHGDKQWSGVDEPLRTITATGKHAALVYSFLLKYYGTAIGQHCIEPLYTVTSKDRFGLATVTIDGELCIIVDIGMRMLTPRELARAQGFDDSYKLIGTKTQQTAFIGNSVSPVMAEAMVRANYSPLAPFIR